MKEILERALNLIKKTGDKVIVVEGNDENASYVIMRFGDYEKLVPEGRGPNLTEWRAPDKIDKINQDIALLSEEAKKAEGIPPAVLPVEEKPDEEESQFYFEPVE